MKFPPQLAIWGAAAVISLVALGLVIHHQRREIRTRVAVQVATRPASGGVVFRDKGCATCHGEYAAGTEFGPPLRNKRSLTSLPRLVTAMWNHAPHMWQAMEVRHLPYPALTYEEMSQLMTYLYISGYADGSVDIKRGERLFEERRCSECHGTDSGSGAPSLQTLSDAEDLLSWTQTLWNHASKMQATMQRKAISWPGFHANDVRDLFAYVRHIRNLPEDYPPGVSGDPDRGWTLFQKKGCIRCHSVSSEASGASSFGADRQLPPTLSEFGAALLNHFPTMETAMGSHKIAPPQFENHDLADIAVFLYSLHYLEPSGSPQIGRSIFAWRGCNQCHGDDAEGASSTPALRGRGQVYTAVRLATSLWAHGGQMYDSTQKSHQPWPNLQDSDIGHLLTFLNTSPDH